MLWRQGDVFIETVGTIPAQSLSAPLPHGTLVHGELTGHSHRIEDMDMATLYSGRNAGEVFVMVNDGGARIVHEEHGTITLETGYYRAWRQREYSPERIRLVVD
ncbi:MAG: hypothetical protein ACK5KM_00690 [Hyphomicrobiaceae bacterium]